MLRNLQYTRAERTFEQRELTNSPPSGPSLTGSPACPSPGTTAPRALPPPQRLVRLPPRPWQLPEFWEIPCTTARPATAKHAGTLTSKGVDWKANAPEGAAPEEMPQTGGAEDLIETTVTEHGAPKPPNVWNADFCPWYFASVFPRSCNGKLAGGASGGGYGVRRPKVLLHGGYVPPHDLPSPLWSTLPPVEMIRL